MTQQTYKYFKNIDLNKSGDLEEIVGILCEDIEKGYFLRCEAAEAREKGLSLTPEQKESERICFDDEVQYIDKIPRPDQPWYVILRKVVAHLVVDQLNTSEIHYAVTTEGWAQLAGVLEKNTRGLSLPKDVATAIEVVPEETQHRLWLQWCYEELNGLGSDDELTLKNKDQLWRIDDFIDSLKKCKDSVEYLKLSLSNMFTWLILPQQDQEILVKGMKEKFGLLDDKCRISEYL